VFQIARTTLTRAGLKLYSFTSCVPALRNYKTVYFDTLRALQERQEAIVDSENLRGSENFSPLIVCVHTCLIAPLSYAGQLEQTASAGY
jgi:hypothetical protein